MVIPINIKFHRIYNLSTQQNSTAGLFEHWQAYLSARSGLFFE